MTDDELKDKWTPTDGTPLVELELKGDGLSSRVAINGQDFPVYSISVQQVVGEMPVVTIQLPARIIATVDSADLIIDELDSYPQ